MAPRYPRRQAYEARLALETCECQSPRARSDGGAAARRGGSRPGQRSRRGAIHVRIAIVSPPWVAVPPQAYGGTENVIDTLARGLQAAGHEVLLFATGDSTCPVPTEWVYPRAVGTAAVTTAAELRHVVHAYEKALAWGA